MLTEAQLPNSNELMVAMIEAKLFPLCCRGAKNAITIIITDVTNGKAKNDGIIAAPSFLCSVLRAGDLAIAVRRKTVFICYILGSVLFGDFSRNDLCKKSRKRA